MPVSFQKVGGEYCLDAGCYPKRGSGAGGGAAATAEDEVKRGAKKSPREPCHGSQICFQDADSLFPIHRKYFEFLGRCDVDVKDTCVIRFCCAKSFAIRQADFSLCENMLTEFLISKGNISELDLPSFANCMKMTTFALIQNRQGSGNRTGNAIKLRNGLPIMPSTLKELDLSEIEDSISHPFNLTVSLARVAALDKLHLRFMLLRTGVDFTTAFRALTMLEVIETEGFDPSPSFWAGCRQLRTLHISGCIAARKPSAKPLFGHSVTARQVVLPPTLESIEIKDCIVPELPPSIGGCLNLESLTVNGCGLTKLPDEMSSLSSLENLVLMNNVLTLEGIAVLSSCSYFQNPPASTSRRSTRAVTLTGNPFPDGTPVNNSIFAHLAAMPRADSGIRKYRYVDIEAATNGFAASKLICADGAFGPVYHGTIGSSNHIAVKQMREDTIHNNEQFVAELRALQQCKHPHLVQLLGCSVDGSKRCVIYEYKMMGSLRSFLAVDKTSKTPKSGWRRRVCWLYQISSALEYLHTIAKPAIIHRDVKTANILLDSALNASLGDFGLARVCSEATERSAPGVSTRIFGTPGYIDPEYSDSGKVSLASDIYSFGIVALEMLTSRNAYDDAHDPPVLRHAFDEAVEDNTLAALCDCSARDATGYSAHWPAPGPGTATKGLIDVIKGCVKTRGARRPATAAVASSLGAVCDEWGCHPHMLLGIAAGGAATSSIDEPDAQSDCVVCMSAKVTHAFVPCGHLCVCREHAQMVQEQDGSCPMCRTAIERAIQIF